VDCGLWIVALGIRHSCLFNGHWCLVIGHSACRLRTELTVERPSTQRRGAPRPTRPQRPPTYGIRLPLRPLLMVCPDAWHLIIFRALGGRNARKCFCKNGTYINLGLSKKVKKPFKTVKKL
jgi:hypothetical protein